MTNQTWSNGLTGLLFSHMSSCSHMHKLTSVSIPCEQSWFGLFSERVLGLICLWAQAQCGRLLPMTLMGIGPESHWQWASSAVRAMASPFSIPYNWYFIKFIVRMSPKINSIIFQQKIGLLHYGNYGPTRSGLFQPQDNPNSGKFLITHWVNNSPTYNY